MYYSQFGQDEYVNDEIFKGKKNGVFVDVGAYDGVFLSNTYFFEKELGWTGICIEPNFEAFKQLVNSRKSINLNLCAFNENTIVEFMNIDGKNVDVFSGINSTYVKTQLDYITDRLDQNKEGVLNIKKINARKLSDIFIENNITHVDFCSIDTEGSELEVLEGINFNNVNIDVIVLENNLYKVNKTSKCEKYLKKLGYKLKTRLDIDEVYVKKS